MKEAKGPRRTESADAKVTLGENIEAYAAALAERDQKIAALEQEVATLKQQLGQDVAQTKDSRAVASVAAPGPEVREAQAHAQATPDQELAKAKKELEEVRGQLLRALADLDNYRKRSARLIEERVASAQKSLVGAIVPALDNLERAVGYQETHGTANVQDLVTGVRMTLWQLREALGRLGLKPIECVGQPFDPRFHEALEVQEVREEVEDGTVLAELQRGYLLGEEVLRPAKVRVAKKSTPRDSEHTS